MATTQAAEPAQKPTADTAVSDESAADGPVAPAEADSATPVQTPPVPTPVKEAGALAPESAADEPSAGEPESPTEEEPAEPQYKPWGMPEPGIAPTAVAMTARGTNFLNEGRVQEAIDQFTKAIALDANYAEAWEKRAEAYAQQGRGEEAAEDRRHLKGLNTSSSPG